MHLCEVFLGKLEPHEYLPILSSIKTIANNKFIIVTYIDKEDVNKGRDIDSVTAEASLPQKIILQGITLPIKDAKHNWKELLRKNVSKLSCAANTKVGIYLSLKIARNKKIIDFSVCNLSMRQHFAGSFKVLIAKRVDTWPQSKVFMVVDVVGSGDITHLTESNKYGCPLPNEFALSERYGSEKLSIIGIVYDDKGKVSGLAMDSLIQPPS